MMDQERFEELLLAEIDGAITLEQRARLDAACGQDPGLARMRRQDLRIAHMMGTLPPALAPISLTADVLRSLDLSSAPEAETGYANEPSGASEAYEDDPFATTNSGSRYREVYEPYREPASVRGTVPWWSALLGSTFLRLSFGMSVMILCVYMGSVIMRQSRGDRGFSPAQEGELPEGAIIAQSETSAIAAGTLPTAEPASALRDIQIAHLESGTKTAIDLNALAELTPLPEEIPPDTDREMASVGKMDPAIEKMLDGSADGPRSAPAPAGVAAVTASASAPDNAAPPSPVTKPVTVLNPVVLADAQPAVDLPEGALETNAPQNGAKDVASSAKPKTEGEGMEKVFDRIREGLADDAPEPAANDGTRVVRSASELRDALANQESRTVTATQPAVSAVSLPAAEKSAPEAGAGAGATVSPTTQTRPSTSPTRVMDEVAELREALKGKNNDRTAQPVSENRIASVPKTEQPAVTTQAKPPTAAEMKPPTSAFAEGAAPKTTMTPEERLRKIEMAIVKNGGTILGRRTDPKDPAATRVKCLMTRAQIKALELDLARQGLAPPKKKTESPKEDSADNDKPVEFEIVVKSR